MMHRRLMMEMSHQFGFAGVCINCRLEGTSGSSFHNKNRQCQSDWSGAGARTHNCTYCPSHHQPPTHTHTHLRNPLMPIELRCSGGWIYRELTLTGSSGIAMGNVGAMLVRTVQPRSVSPTLTDLNSHSQMINHLRSHIGTGSNQFIAAHITVN